MSFFTRFAPFSAIMDLRRYLASRPVYEIGGLFGAIAITVLIVTVMANDSSSITVPYKRNIIYVEQWQADRTDAEIHAQQQIDKVVRDRERAELDRLKKKKQAEFKRLDDKLKAYGF